MSTITDALEAETESILSLVLTVKLAGDIDDDGDIDMYDFAELAQNWLVGTE